MTDAPVAAAPIAIATWRFRRNRPAQPPPEPVFAASSPRLTARRAAGVSVLLSAGLFAGCGGGGGGGGGAPGISVNLSTVAVDEPFGVPADGSSTVEVVATVVDTAGRPRQGAPLELRASGVGNTIVPFGLTDQLGVARGRLASSIAERKTITVAVLPGPGEVVLAPVTAEFVRFAPHRYYVRQSGSDANTGNLPLAAWRTIGRALSQAGAGDTVYVGAGIYDPIEITTQASAEDPLVLRGDPLGTFTGDAGAVLIDAGGGTHGIRFAGASNVIVRGFSIRGARTIEGKGGGVWAAAAGSEGCAAVDCTIFENERGVDVRAARGFRVEGNCISMNEEHGVVCGVTNSTVVANNLLYANGGSGLFLDGRSLELSVTLNTFHRNALDQVHEGTAGSTGAIRDNVLSEGSADGVELASGSSLLLASNLAWANAGAAYIDPDRAVGPTNLVGDPRFVDPFGIDGILGGPGAADDDFRMDATGAALDRSDLDARNLQLWFRGALASLTSRGDQEYDGRGLDAVIANLGFHYPVPLDPFASLEARGARAAWTLPGDVVVNGRSRRPGGWSTSRSIQATNRDVRWVLERASSTIQPDELVAVLADTGTKTDLFVRHWDGRMWTDESVRPLTSVIQSAHADERGFDLEFESSSGDALVVWANDGAVPSFRTLRAGTWSKDALAYPDPLGTGTILWVELVTDPKSDRMMLVTLDSERDLVAVPWDGAAFGAPTLLETGVIVAQDFKAFDVAYESQSGDVLVAWGFAPATEETRFAAFEVATSSWRFGTHPSTDAVGALIVLASDPKSDRIAAGFGEGTFGDDVTVAMWDGREWTHTAELTLASPVGQRALEIGWVGDSGRAFALWRSAGLTGSFNFALFQGSWRIQPVVSLPGVRRIMQADARAVPGEQRVLVLLLDESGALFGLTFDGTSWSVENGGQPLETGFDALAPTTPFSLDLRRS